MTARWSLRFFSPSRLPHAQLRHESCEAIHDGNQLLRRLGVKPLVDPTAQRDQLVVDVAESLKIVIVHHRTPRHLSITSSGRRRPRLGGEMRTFTPWCLSWR